MIIKNYKKYNEIKHLHNKKKQLQKGNYFKKGETFAKETNIF